MAFPLFFSFKLDARLFVFVFGVILVVHRR